VNSSRQLTLRRKTAKVLVLRARIVLACAFGQDNKVVAARQHVTPQIDPRFVEKVRDIVGPYMGRL
jgi:hypothetical protein